MPGGRERERERERDGWGSALRGVGGLLPTPCPEQSKEKERERETVAMLGSSHPSCLSLGVGRSRRPLEFAEGTLCGLGGVDVSGAGGGVA